MKAFSSLFLHLRFVTYSCLDITVWALLYSIQHSYNFVCIMSSYAEKKRKLQEEEEKAKAVTSVIVQFQTADVLLWESC